MASNDYEQWDKDPEEINHYAAICVALPLTEDEVTLSFVYVPPKLAKIEASDVKLKYSRTNDGKGKNPNDNDDEDDSASWKQTSSRRQLSSSLCPGCSSYQTDRPGEGNRCHREDVGVAEKVSEPSRVRTEHVGAPVITNCNEVLKKMMQLS